MPGILFDLDGVFYVGDRAIAGGVEVLHWALERHIPHCFVTNTSSRPRSALVEKLAGLGIDADESLILSPPVAARNWIVQQGKDPVALFVPPDTRSEFAPLEILSSENGRPVGSVVIGDLGSEWDFATLNDAFRLLMSDSAPALVALGMTRYWRAPDGLRLDVAPFVRALEHASGREAVVLGKPSQYFFSAALEMIGCRADEAVMIGDDIRGDVAGAQAAGIRGVLVRTGKFHPADLEGETTPDAVLDSVVELPAWWRAQVS